MGKVHDRIEHKRRVKHAMKRTQWEELDAMYEVLARAIATVANDVNRIIVMVKDNNLETTPQFNTNVSGISRDIGGLVTDLLAVKDMHRSKTGSVANEEDLSLCLSIFEEYSNLNTVFQTVTFTPMLAINEYIADMSLKYRDEEVLDV